MYIFMFYSLFINKNVHVFWCFLLLCFDYIFMNKNVRNTKNKKKQLYYKKDKKCNNIKKRIKTTKKNRKSVENGNNKTG